MPGRARRLDRAAVTVDDALGCGQADADAGEFVLPVQTLERLKEFFSVGHVEAGAVIRDTEKGTRCVCYHRGEIRQRSAKVTFTMVPVPPAFCNRPPSLRRPVAGRRLGW